MKLLVFFMLSLFPICAAAGPECPENFSKLKAAVSNYVLTEEDKNLILRVCRNPYRSEDLIKAPAQGKSPEFLYYLLLQCFPNNGPTNILNQGVSNFLAYGRSYQLWEDLRRARPSFAGVPADWKIRWSKDAILNLETTRLAVQDNMVGLSSLLVSTKMALPFLPAEVLQETVRFLAAQHAEKMVSSHFPGMFPPKAFQFAKNAMKRELGLNYKPITDIVEVYRRSTMTPHIISVDPFVVRGTGRPSESNYGLQSRALDSLVVSESDPAGKIIASEGVTWAINKNEFHAAYSVKLGQLPTEVAPAMEKLDFDGMWADKKLTGLIFPSANMGLGEAGAHEVMNHYRDYYMENGFRFSAKNSVVDVQKFMDQEVSSGRMDYIFKESHSDGSDTTLVAIPKTGHMLTGTKTLPGGKSEVIYIFYPNNAELRAEKGEELTFASVGSWMKKRSENKGKQLFFVDTSCYGIRTMCKLSSAVQDKNLVVSGSDNTVETFANESQSSTMNILDGLRSNKKFSEISAKIGTMQNSAGENPDSFLLPGGEKWIQRIHGEMKRTVRMEVLLKENGKPVTIETMGNQ